MFCHIVLEYRRFSARRSQAAAPVLVHHQASGAKASTSTWMSVSAPLMMASHMNFHPGADISACFLLKRWCVHSSRPKRRLFICLFAGKQTDKRHSRLALARSERRCGREGKDKLCGVFTRPWVVRGLGSDVR